MNLETLNRYHEDGLLYKQTHPTLPLTIWNYSESVQYEKKWDEITLSCRGLVTDNEGNVVARPFKKFFNIEENKHTPTDKFDVYEKMDGSLGIFFNYKGEWVLATRGSFTSDQSVKGTELLQKYDYNRLNPDYTYLFEIIYPENRIVCTYDFEDLVLLGMIHTSTGDEVNIHSGNNEDIRFKNLLNNLGFNIVIKYDGISDYSYLKQSIADNKEGFVVRFSNGDRMKIKGEEYLRLHKIMTNLSTRNIWETLANGEDLITSLVDVPDEFHAKIRAYVDELTSQYKTLEKEYTCIFNTIVKGLENHNVPQEKQRAVFAQYALQYKYPPLLFTMLDKRNYSKIIWDLIYPEYRKL